MGILKYKVVLSVLLLVFLNHLLIAQLKGIVKSEEGEPLGFATVHIKNTTKGTTANADGAFNLVLPPGNYELVFQFLGYEQKTVSINLGKDELFVEAILIEQTYNIPLLEIRADAEDPAYAIIRKAIQQRKFYKGYLSSYACDVYIKGIMTLEQVPERMLARITESMDGWIDSSGRGIIYLSESESRYFFEQPNKTKEQMVSSKVSGNNRGFSFNRFGFLNFYENSFEINRPIVNPIGNNALQHYRYRLDRSYFDEENRQINKIEVIPRVSTGPVFSGYIYILEGKWLIHSLDLNLSGAASKIDGLDNIRIQQQYIPANKDYWTLFNQQIDFDAGIFGFKFKGKFVAITSNYELNIPFEKGFFGKEVVKIEPGSNEKEDAYWEANRPIPLTEDEEIDYFKKDSIEAHRQTKPYMDSIDRVYNQFKWDNLLTGVSVRRSYTGRTYSTGWNTNLFNAVQGWTAGIKGSFSQNWKDNPGKQIEIKGGYMYGFSDKQHRFNGEYYHRFNGTNQFFIHVQGGDELKDLNPVNSINNLYNAWQLLFYKQSINRYYNSRYLKFSTGREVGIGHFLRMNATYDNRIQAYNTSEFSFSSRTNDFDPNNDLGKDGELIQLSDHQMMTLEMLFTWRPGVRYISYPDRRFYRRSAYPEVTFGYKTGFDVENGLDHQLLQLTVRKNDILTKVYGSLSFYVEGGYFIQSPVYFHDYKHFTGGPITILGPNNYLKGFKLLPLYSFSTDDLFVHGHLEWNDNSFLFDKIPGLNKLGVSIVYGASHLYTPERSHYSELFVSIDRLGFSIFRLMRLDFVFAFQEGKYDGFGIRLGINRAF